ncbi:MAG: DUF748 domain-containing protein [Alphaproteobacteria bacterium]|nr:DUF748 domain-containing protein [Alphaproteobacteria bacterium]
MRIFLRRFVIILCILTGIYFLATPFFVPWAFEKQARQVFASRVDGTLDFSGVVFNPFSLTVMVQDLDIRDRNAKPVISAKQAKLNLSWRSLWAGEVITDRLLFDALNVLLEIEEDGKTNIGLMLRESEQPSGTSAPSVHVGGLMARAAKVRVRNHTGHEISVGPTDISLGAFSFHEGHAINLNQFALQIGGGRIVAAGALERSDGFLRLDLTLDQVPVTAIAGFIPLTDIYARGGEVSGTAALVIGDNFTVDGDLSLADFTLALDGVYVRRLQVPYADISGFSYDMNADRIGAAKVWIDGGDALMVRGLTPEENGETAADEPSGPSFSVKQILLSGGSLVFEDQTFEDSHIVPLSSLDAVIDDFSYDGSLSMGFRADASAGPNSPLVTAGYLQYGETLEATVSMNIDRLDHSVLKPYLYKAVGRSTRAGKAYLEFDYYVSDGEIDGLNTFLFDRWEWGDKNPNFDGEEIPLKKAFNLLEDKGGRVAMEIPVEGELLDPTFRVEKLVRRATNKAVSNIITAPFRLLGMLIPGGGRDDLDLDKVEFEPSSTELSALQKARLNALAEALKERPKFRLRIEGTALPGVDLASDNTGEGGNPPALIRLANQRAEAVYQYLLVDGVAADRLEKTTLEALNGKAPKAPMVRLDVLKD